MTSSRLLLQCLLRIESLVSGMMWSSLFIYTKDGKNNFNKQLDEIFKTIFLFRLYPVDKTRSDDGTEMSAEVVQEPQETKKDK